MKALYNSCCYNKRKCKLCTKVWRLMVGSCDTGSGKFVTNRGTLVTQDMVAFMPVSKKYKVSKIIKKD